MEKQKISILGCGWLGFELAKNLKQKYFVQGSTRSKKKINSFKKQGITHHLIDFSADLKSPYFDITKSKNKAFFSCNVLIISLPVRFDPSVTSHLEHKYFRLIKQIKEEIIHFKIKKIILLSSTAAYENTNYEYTDNGEHISISENSYLNNLTPKSKLIRMSEAELLKSNNLFKSSVVRLGGLVGKKRNPVYWINKPKLRSQNGFLNLIHYRDVVNVLSLMIENDIFNNEIYNLASDKIYLKDFFYQQIMNKLGQKKKLDLPQYKCFNQIDSSKIKRTLNYKMTYPDLLNWALKSKTLK